MPITSKRKTLLCFLLFVGCNCSAEAGDIHLRTRVVCERPIIRLADIADISGLGADETAALQNVRMLVAPAFGHEKLIHLTEIQELLHLHEIDPRKLSFSGAKTVTVQRSDLKLANEVQTGRFRNPVKQRSLDQVVRDLIVTYLQSRQTDNFDWTVTPLWLPKYEQALVQAKTLRVEGGQEPFLGKQMFYIIAQRDAEQVRVPVPTEVLRTQSVVVVTRGVKRGEVLRAGDVEVRPSTSTVAGVAFAHSLEEVVGKELDRALFPGQAITTNLVAPNRLIHRGDAVKLCSVAPGVMVTETAKALQDGALGELVELEKADSREKIMARVTAAQQATIYASAATYPGAKALDQTPAARLNRLPQDDALRVRK